jgi:tetratricopeptide (TPR) repeat protein
MPAIGGRVSVLLVLGLVGIGLDSPAAFAQVPAIGAAGVCEPGGNWQAGCRGAMPTAPRAGTRTGGGKGRSGGGGQANAAIGAMQGMMGVMGMVMDGIAQMEAAQQQQRAVQAQNFNQQGIAFYNQNDWQAASNAFSQALSMVPHDENIRGNLLEANRMLTAQAQEAERRNQAQLAESRQRIGAMLGDLNPDGRAGGSGDAALVPAGTAIFGTGGGGTPPQVKRETRPVSGSSASGSKDLDFVSGKESLYSKGNRWSAAPDMRPAPAKAEADGKLDFISAEPRPLKTALAAPASASASARKDADGMLRAAMSGSNGDWEKARSKLVAAARNAPGNPEAQTALRRFEGLYREYRRDTNQADGAPPSSMEPRQTAGLVPPRQIPEGKGEAAHEANRLGNEAFYDAANGDLVRAREHLEHAARLAPEDAGVKSALSQLDSLESAAQERRNRLVDEPQLQWAPNEAQARAKAEAVKGRWALEHGYYDVAAESYLNAYVWDPTRRGSYHNGYVASRLGVVLHQGHRRNTVAAAGDTILDPPPGGDEVGLLDNLRR